VITELKVYYKSDLETVVDDDFERNLGYFLAQYTLKRYASGYNLDTDIRDIAFDQKGRRVHK